MSAESISSLLNLFHLSPYINILRTIYLKTIAHIIIETMGLAKITREEI